MVAAGSSTAIQHSSITSLGCREALPQQHSLLRTWPVILAKLSLVILLSSDLSRFCACSSSGSSVRVAPSCGEQREQGTCQWVAMLAAWRR